jgi:iron complex outermembrane receptor protein
MSSIFMIKIMKQVSAKTYTIIICISLALTVNAVYAQDEKSQQMDPENVLEVIEVTARKTIESLQRVPVSVTSISSAKLNNRGIDTLSEIHQYSPNTTLQVSAGTSSTLSAFIRGVGQEDQLWGYESGVGVYIDDVYIARPQGAVLEMLDVERVEVLRGPQGSLYGKNTLGGAVKYITKKMTGETEFNAIVTLGDHGRKDLKVAGQFPLVENKLYLGLAGASLNRDGFGRFITSDLAGQNRENYNKDITASRLTLEYHGNSQFFGRLNYDKTDDDSNAVGGHRFLPSILASDYNVEDIPSNVYDSGTSLPTWNKLTTEGLSLTLSYQINDWWSLKSVSAKRENYSLANIDFDNTHLRIFDVPAIYDDKQFTQEFQVNYYGSNLTLVSGLYYYDGDSCGVFDGIIDVLGHSLNMPGFTLEISGCSNSKSIAAYSQGSYHFSDSLSMTLGARFTREEKEAIVYSGAVYETLYPRSNWVDNFHRDETLVENNIVEVLNDSKKWSRMTPKVGFEYQQSDDLLWYVSYAQGFKSGMFNPRAQTAEPAVNPEVVDSFEVGIKSEWFDRLRINATLFSLDHKDRQFVTVLEGEGPGDLDQRLGNIGKSKAQGLELEMSLIASNALTISFNLGLIDSDFTEALTYDGVDNSDISERFSIIQTPDTTANLSFDYNFETNFGDFNFNGNYFYRSDYDLIVLDNLKSQSGFGLANASLNWFNQEGDWQVGLHLKNITDKRYLTGSFAFVTRDADSGEYVPGLAGDNILNDYYGEPRTIALTIGYQF